MAKMVKRGSKYFYWTLLEAVRTGKSARVPIFKDISRKTSFSSHESYS
ncbi:MAG TPA: hypothetical protein DCR90_05140 [Fusobacteriaceae bacterium]|nr:hypothetical protein [Fusobacteriaceae bacterium]